MTLAALCAAVRAEADRLLPELRVRRVRGGVAVRGAWTLDIFRRGHAVRIDRPGWYEWLDWRVGLRALALDTARAEVQRLEAEWRAAEQAAGDACNRMDDAAARLQALEIGT